MPRKTFTAGEVLAAADVNEYLMDQSVMTFADSTARGSAIGTAIAQEGMLTYLEDTDAFEYWDGSAFTGLAPTSNAGLVHLNTTTFSSVASVSLPNDTFTSEYSNYRVIGSLTNSVGAAAQTIRFRTAGSDNTTANYQQVLFTAQGSALSAAAGTGLTSIAYTTPSEICTNIYDLDIYKPKLTAKTYFLSKAMLQDGPFVRNGGGGFTATTSFDSLTFSAASGNITGSLNVYGYKE
jgi:hypothetical protein